MIDGFARICFCKSSTSCDLPYLIYDVFLWVWLQENCPADVDVKVEVTSNELQQDTMVKLFEQQVSGFVEQAKVYFSATRCVCVLYMCVMIKHFWALFSHFEQIPNCFYFTFYYP